MGLEFPFCRRILGGPFDSFLFTEPFLLLLPIFGCSFALPLCGSRAGCVWHKYSREPRAHALAQAVCPRSVPCISETNQPHQDDCCALLLLLCFSGAPLLLLSLTHVQIIKVRSTAQARRIWRAGPHAFLDCALVLALCAFSDLVVTLHVLVVQSRRFVSRAGDRSGFYY